MKLILIIVAAFFTTTPCFAQSIEVTCATPSGAWLKIYLRDSKPNLEVNEIGLVQGMQLQSDNSFLPLIQATNVKLTSKSDASGFIEKVSGDMGRSGEFSLSLTPSADQMGYDGTLVSTIFAPGLSYPEGVAVGCSQTNPRPIFTGSN